MTLTTQQNSVRFKTTPVFKWNYESNARIRINQGGSSSGKTIGILQVLHMLLEAQPRVCTIVGQDIPNLKKGALRDFQLRVLSENPWMRNSIKEYNKTERTYTYHNGSILEFTSYKDAQDAKNGKRDILFVNEANGVAFPIYEQLEMRTSEIIFLDYNPTAPFYAHERLMSRSNAVTFYSNFTHNRFIDPNVRDYLIGLKEIDLESWRVYGLGKTGAIQDLVIEKITVVDAMPRYLKKRGYGMDFGYRAHPTALIECGLANEREIYIDEKFYLRNMKTLDIHLAMQAMNLPRSRKIYADPADPRAVDDLKERGWRLKEAIKGRDSVNYGIQLLNQYEIFVTQRSLNVLTEQQKYSYKTAKDGTPTNEPIKAFDDAWDAIRYWAVMNLKPIRKIRSAYRSAIA